MIDRDLLLKNFMNASHRDADDEKIANFKDQLNIFCDAIEANYNGMSATCPDLSMAEGEEPCHGESCDCKYETLEILACAEAVDFSFYVTTSEADNRADYVKTNYTVDNGNVVMVTYKKGSQKVNFILNYNSYAVTVRMNGQLVKVGSYAYTPYN